MTPEKAALLAELMAERFPSADALEAESRRPMPSRGRVAAESLAAAELAARAARIRWALSDTPQAIAMRRRVVDAMPVDGRDVAPAVRLRGVA